ncbi:putative RNA-directed DNA polymerase [Helianthus annuus]|nr:putative RNA-directed DNA polymerase [Helianthus annuus]
MNTNKKEKQVTVTPEGKKVIKLVQSRQKQMKNLNDGPRLPPFLAFRVGNNANCIGDTPIPDMSLEEMCKELSSLQQLKPNKCDASMKEEIMFQKNKAARIKELSIGIQLAKDLKAKKEADRIAKEAEERKKSVLGQFNGGNLVFRASKSEGKDKGIDEMKKTSKGSLDLAADSKDSHSSKSQHSSYAKAVSGDVSEPSVGPIVFCPPKTLESGEKIVVIKPEYIEKIKQIYHKHLYGYFVGTSCSLAWARVNLNKMWKKYGILDVSSNGKGLFYFKFKTEEGMNGALKAGPWVVNGIPLVVKKWEVGVNLEKTEPSKVPVWVTFNNVPMELWNVQGLCEIASCIGNPLLFDNVTVDKCKQKKGMSGFARILIKIPVMEVMPNRVRAFYIQENDQLGVSIDVKVEYQKVPDRCLHCKVFGHTFENCTHRELTEVEKAARLKIIESMNMVQSTPKKNRMVDAEGFEIINRRGQTEKNTRWGNNRDTQGRQVNKSSNKNQNGGEGGSKELKLQQKSDNYRKWKAIREEEEKSRKGKGILEKGIKIKQEYKIKGNGRRKVEGEGSGMCNLKMENSFAALDQIMEDSIEDSLKGSDNLLKEAGVSNLKQSLSPKNLAGGSKQRSPSKSLPFNESSSSSIQHNSHSSLFSSEPVHSVADPKDIQPLASSQFNTPPPLPGSESFLPQSNVSEHDVNVAFLNIQSSNPVVQHFDLGLSQGQVDEVMKFVTNRIKLSKSVESRWSHEQYKLYVDMCRRYNFSEGLDDDNFGEELSEYEVGSDEDEAAQDMKMDVETQKQNAQEGSSFVINVLNDNDIGICCLMESHVKGQNIDKVCGRIFKGWEWFSNKEYCSNWVRIIVGWKPNLADIMIINHNDQAIHCFVKPLDGRSPFYCSFVYGHVRANKRKPLWRDLEQFGGTINGGAWLVLGDFNVIMEPSERSMGSSVVTSSMEDLRDCCSNICIEDLPATGMKYTWNKSPGKSDGLLKKLDRVMSNEEFMNIFSDAITKFLPFFHSDHSPALVSIKGLKFWQPRAFKFMNFLAYKTQFIPIVSNVWQNKIRGCYMYSVVKKLKDLKKPLRKLGKEQGNLTEKVRKLSYELGLVQEAMVKDPHNQDIRDEEAGYVSALKRAMVDEEIFLQQKAKVGWLKAGDQNSAYFHKAVKGRQNKSRINSILDKEGKFVEGQLVGDAFVKHFESFMGRNVEVQCIRDPSSLISTRTDEEVKNAIFDIDDNKAPGPDGYSSKFFKSAWPIVGKEVCLAVKEFFHNGKLLSEVNATIISLVPKCVNPRSVTDFRPIACCNVLYKCITKIICNRIKDHLSLIVSECQSAFIPGRQISDNILLTQELLRNYHLKRREARITMKIDLQKAYDTVNHGFLEQCLKMFGFHPCMVSWIMTCIRSAAYSINVNGSVHGYFKGMRGLRQGDPMSPYLFTIVMEVLNQMILRNIREQGNFTYHWGCKDLKITHVCFADDLMLFSHADEDSVKILKTALEEFSAVSGLVPNLNKSTMYFGNVFGCMQERIKALFPFKVGLLPVRYLGIPLLSKRLYSKDCSALIDKVRKRLNDWKNKALSFAGRLQLIRSVISSLNVYWASMFLLPINVIEDIERLIGKFLWANSESAKGKARVSWEKVCCPKSQGGLGIRPLRVINQTLVSKHIWSLISKKETIWTKWIWVNRTKGKNLWEVSDKENTSWSWKSIIRTRELIWPHCVKSLGNGAGTSVWFDMWCPLSPICKFISMRDINRAGLSSGCTVDQITRNGDWNWPEEWRQKYPCLFSMEIPRLIEGKDDSILWKTSDGKHVNFSTQVVFKDLCFPRQVEQWTKVVWFSQSIPRHAFMLWLAYQERLLTQDRLERWEVVNVLDCAFCHGQMDDHDHLFFECVYPREIWEYFKTL